MQLKEPKTFDEQIELICSKGFIIEDTNACKEFLKSANYYRLSAYMLPFKESASGHNDKYKKGVSFLKIRRIYEFDAAMRNLLYGIIEDIELYTKTQLAYYHGHKYGPDGYKKSECFSAKHKSEKFSERINECVQDNKRTLVVKHHQQYYQGEFPIWVIIEFFSIGMLSYFYADLETSDRKAVAKESFTTRADLLESWLRCITDLRNKCAHYSRLYYWQFKALPKMPYDLVLSDKTRLFAQLLVLKFMYYDNQKWDKIILPRFWLLLDEFAEYIELKHIGFPANWFELLKK